MAEPVRLVVWDLDETFWDGTLTEGGVRPNEAAIRTVRTLAERGIVSSICSKNDCASVVRVLQDWGVWDHFIFPSIDWSPKGPRLAALIEAVQLRPETVLLIDDNPLNREEARYFVPGLQVADETVIPGLLDHPLCRGKDDPDLSRLRQYRLLETRAADRESRGGDVRAFLRESGIRVSIEYDVEAHLDRAIELINRTNQLNFTKRRLPEDIEDARRVLREEMRPFYAHAGLVRVRDNYGEYGFVGFFLQEAIVSNHWLKHFCFSCRTLGMQVETWLYRRLGRPDLHVNGAVLTDLTDESAEIDWIALDTGTPAAMTAVPRLGSVLVRGGCDLQAVADYLRVQSRHLVGEFNTMRSGLEIRLDHSLFLRHAVEGLGEAAAAAFRPLGYREEDFTSAVTALGDGSLCLLSFWADAAFPLYRHRATGATIPFAPPGLGHVNVLKWSRDQVFAQLGNNAAKAAFAWLEAEFEHVGIIGEQDFKHNLQAALDAVPSGVQIIIGLADEVPWPTVPFFARRHADLNRWTWEVAGDNPDVSLISVRECVQDPRDVIDFNHFERRVYHRLAARVIERAHALHELIAPALATP